MKLEGLTPILNVSDVPASRAWFAKLGWQRGFAWSGGGMIPNGADHGPHGPAQFASMCSGKFEIFLCLNGQGARNGRAPRHPGDDDTGGVWMSWFLDSPAAVDAVYEQAKQHGMTISYPPTNEPWGIREFHLVHPDGHTFRVGAGIESE